MEIEDIFNKYKYCPICNDLLVLRIYKYEELYAYIADLPMDDLKNYINKEETIKTSDLIEISCPGGFSIGTTDNFSPYSSDYEINFLVYNGNFYFESEGIDIRKYKIRNFEYKNTKRSYIECNNIDGSNKINVIDFSYIQFDDLYELSKDIENLTSKIEKIILLK